MGESFKWKIDVRAKSLCSFFLIVLFLSSCASHKASVKSELEPQVQAEAMPGIEISKYILGFGDELEISLYGHEEMRRKLQILPDGNIHYPLVGEIQAQGLSINQLRDEIRQGLLKYFLDPKVSVIVTSVKSQKIFVLGEVGNPGVYLLEGPKTVIEAVSEAGGFTLDAKENNVMLIRGAPSNPQPKILDIKAALKRTDMTQNVVLQKWDIIYVPATTIADVQRFFDRLWTIIPARYGFFWRID